jgi:hypothetical protein
VPPPSDEDTSLCSQFPPEIEEYILSLACVDNMTRKAEEWEEVHFFIKQLGEMTPKPEDYFDVNEYRSDLSLAGTLRERIRACENGVDDSPEYDTICEYRDIYG